MSLVQVEKILIWISKGSFEMLLNKYNSGEAIVTITDDDAVEYSIDQTSPDGIYSRSVNVLLAMILLMSFRKAVYRKMRFYQRLKE